MQEINSFIISCTRMLSSNLIELLGKFTAEEIKEFGEFVSSPFFNKNENVIKLFGYIKKYFPELDSRKLEKEYAYSKIWSKQKYNDGYMRTLMFRLQRLGEEYLSYINYRKIEEKVKVNLLEELNKRKLDKAFLKNLQEQENEFEESEYKGYNYFHYKNELELQKQLFYNWRRFKEKDLKDYNDKSFFNSIEYVISAFLIRVLSKYLFLIAKGQYEKIDYDYKFLDTVIDFLQNSDDRFKKNPVINLHLNEILLLKTRDESYYYILKDMFIKENKTFSHDERYSLHNVLIQYLSQRIYEGGMKFKTERFELYQIALKQNTFKGSEDLYFDDLMFGGIVSVAVSLNNYEWTENFIEKYKNQLAPGNRATIINFSLAKLSFYKKDFTMALKYLSKIASIRNIQYKTAVRDITLMTYYELSLFSQAYFLADSYRHFLVKNKAYYSELRFERMSNFLKYFVKITKLKENMIKHDFKEIKYEIDKTTNIMERDWLIEKINEFGE